MGDVAEMMLDGTLCEGCGAYLGAGGGYPRRCQSCQTPATKTKPATAKAKCPQCGKTVKAAGLNDHLRDAHRSN